MAFLDDDTADDDPTAPEPEAPVMPPVKPPPVDFWPATDPAVKDLPDEVHDGDLEPEKAH